MAILTLLALCLPTLAAQDTVPPPRETRLVLQITVDQLRGDMLPRFEHRFGEGGFRRLLDQGVHYLDAHYRHSITSTAAGHATLVTGGHPSGHGLVSNNWLDRSSGERVYCVEDPQFRIHGAPQRPHQGAGPRNLTSSTVGDELFLATAGRAKVHSVSVKDRGAIVPAGHHGKAFWYEPGSGRFVTSEYYYEEPPVWLKEWNAAGHARAWSQGSWELLQERSAYLYAGQDDRPCERGHQHLGTTFPHPLQGATPAATFGALRFTPMVDELTTSLALELLDAEQLGADEVPDYLAISYSATDYIGHAFGPHSLEAEDNLLRLDRTLARLLDAIDRRIGLARVLVVLSSDHGVDASPEHRHSLTCNDREHASALTARAAGGRVLIDRPLDDRCCAAGRHDPAKFRAHANRRIQERFGLDAAEDLIAGFYNPSFYLKEARIAELGLELAAVESVVAEAIGEYPGFALAVTRSQLLRGEVPDQHLFRMVQRSFHPQRSGHVLVAAAPFWYLYYNPMAHTAIHGSPHAYDTHVPILFSRPGTRPVEIARRVGVESVAPTISALLGIEPPSASVGSALEEVAAALREHGGGETMTVDSETKSVDGGQADW